MDRAGRGSTFAAVRLHLSSMILVHQISYFWPSRCLEHIVIELLVLSRLSEDEQ